MALSDKDIVITPNKGQSSDPQIVFSGASSTLGPQNITLRVYPTDNGTLSFEGSAGQLFSITNSLTGSIFSVNDVSGIPSIEVFDTGNVRLAQYSGNVLLGTATDNGQKFQVAGTTALGTNLANYLTVTGAATANAVNISTAGSDTNIGLTITTKGTGNIVLDTGTSTGDIELKPGASNVRIYDDDSSHYYRIVTGNITANYDITFPAGNVTLQTGTMAVTGTGLNQFAATTSAQLAGIISDETGSGALVFATSPTLVTPNIGVATGTSFNSITGLSSTNPLVNGTAAVGSSTLVSRQDHVHPTDTTRAAAAITISTTAPISGGGDLSANRTFSLASGYGDTQNPYGSKTANYFLAAPNGSAGAPTFRAIVAADIPTLNQNTTGTSSNVTGTVAITNGGTGATTNTAARTNLGATTVGANLFTLVNPSAITFIRVNADNTVSTLDAATFRTAIGAGTSSTTGTVTSVGGTGTVSGLTLSGTVTTSGNLTLSGTLAVTASNFASQTANTFLAAPNGAAGVPTFRAIVAADVPTLNQNTTGTAANVTGTVAIANGGTGATTSQAAINALAAATTSGQYLRGNGTNVVMSAIQAGDVPTLNQNTTGSAATLTTARTLTIGSTGKTFDGSANVSWTLAEIGALGSSAKAADSELLDGVDSGSFLRSDAADTLSSIITIDATGNIVYSDSGGTYIPRPSAASYKTTAATITGACTIQLPTALWANINDMVSFWVDIYDYNANESVSIFVYGYAYGSSTGQWTNTGATILTPRTDRDYTVRFCHDGTRHVVCIGEITSTWSYPQVVVRDFQAGYTAAASTFDNGWEITFLTTLPTVMSTNSGNLVVAKSASTLTTARTINGTSFDGSANITITANTTNTLTRGTYLTGSNFNGSAATTWDVDATSANTASKVVARDASGNFTAGTITATDFNSTSDVNLKENIKPAPGYDALSKINAVEFTWKSSGKKSYGVIAQELEETMPELVSQDEEGIKTVSYTPLIAVLTNTVKEQQDRINRLEEIINTLLAKDK